MAKGLERGAYVRVLAAVYASMFLIRLAFGVTVITFARYLPEGDFVYSLVVTASPLLELITVAFAGVFIDRYGRKGVLLTGLGLAAVSLYGLALTKNVVLLGMINALHGIAAALILVTTLAIIATFAPAEHRGRDMGLFNLANVFGWMAGFALGFILSDAFASRLEYTFVIAGGLATAGLLFANRMLHLPETAGPPPQHNPSLRQLAQVGKNVNLLLLTIPWLIVFMLVAALITFFPRVAGSVDVAGSGSALGVLAVAALLVVSQLFWGRLADRQGREVIMLVGALGFALLMGTVVYGFFEAGSTLEVVSDQTFNATGPTRAATSTDAVAVHDPDAPAWVEGFEPTSGPPGTPVTITGVGLTGASRVRFAGIDAVFIVRNDTHIDVIVPPEAGVGPIAVVVPTPSTVIAGNVFAHWVLLLLFLFTALAFAPAGLAAIADEAKEGNQGTTMATYSLTLSLGFIIGPPAVGFISERFGGAGMVLFFAALAVILLAVVMTRFIQAQIKKAQRRAWGKL